VLPNLLRLVYSTCCFSFFININVFTLRLQKLSINTLSKGNSNDHVIRISKNKNIRPTIRRKQSKLALRTFVQGGGCSGFSYGFTFDEEQNEDDFEVSVGNFKVLIDATSMQYLQGAEIDYKEDLMGASFTIKNPNAETTCGCGSSFSVSEDHFDHDGVY
jgi:iron-sulfur cluster insertion protein